MWLISFIIAIFLVKYFLSPDAAISGTFMWSVITGILTFGLLHMGEKFRKQYFPEGNEEWLS